MITTERCVNAFEKIKLKPCRHQFTRSEGGRLVSCCGLTAIMLADGFSKDQIGNYLLTSIIKTTMANHVNESLPYVEGFIHGWDDISPPSNLGEDETEFMKGYTNGSFAYLVVTNQ